jgi:multidrug efflux pump subunit AcrA (membrane-fusion protein)
VLDIKVLRDDPQAAREAALKKRMPDRAAAVDRALELDAELRLLIPKLDAMRAEQKAASKELGKLTPAEREAFLAGQKAKKAEVQQLEEREKLLSASNGDLRARSEKKEAELKSSFEMREAEFSVNGVSAYLRLTEPLPAGTRITVVNRVGKTWYDRGLTTATSGVTLLENATPIAKFIAEKTTSIPE